MFSRSHQRPDRGIVLLIALGMLSLFSVLIVSYVVFSSQHNQIAISAAQRRAENIDPAPIFETIIQTIVAGDSNPNSPAFHEDLLGDLWGRDHLHLRVAHRRTGAAPTVALAQRGTLMQPMPTNQTDPVSTLFKFPIHLASWHHNGNTADPFTTELTSEVVAPLTAAEFGGVNWEQILRSRHLPDYRINDVFAGRLVTFTEGPLANETFRVIRSFGTVSSSVGNADVGLAGCLIIDLAEMGTSEIEYNDVTVDLYRLATDNPNALLYDLGPDNGPGIKNFDDNGNSIIDDDPEQGMPGSDDVGYPILMNGLPFSGRGRNATGANLVSIPDAVDPNDTTRDRIFDPQFGIELLPNQKITGLSRQSAFAEPDEVYDAADFDNWYLSWQPSDHRGILPQVAAVTGLDPKAAPNVIPSYHRPSIINYLMNAPIWYDDNGNGAQDPPELKRYAALVSTNASDAIRLRILYQRIRAAVYRPLNFSHTFFPSVPLYPPPINPSDVNVDGNPFDGAPGFSGSNSTAILNNAIDTVNFPSAHASLGLLATWLINGPWDVDNDGDDVADSMWIDFDLPQQTLPDGTIVRPLIAPLIEDMDGKINLNRAGTWSQFTSGRFSLSNPTSYAPNPPPNPDAQFFATQRALQFFGRGSGVGPAEISFSHLFDEYRTLSPLQPLFYTQTSPAGTNVLRTRAGNILQSRYGGTVYDFVSSLLDYPVAMPGQEVGPSGQTLFSDPLSRLIHPMRRDLHAFNTPLARAIDMHGRSTMRKDFAGNARDDFLGAAVPNPVPTEPGVVIGEVINQPYEFETDLPAGNDRPFTASEFYSLVKRGTSNAVSRRLDELLGDVADRNEAIDRLVSFDSRSLDVVELPGGQSVVQFVISRLPENLRQASPQVINQQIERILAVELRKGSRFNLNRSLSNGQDDNGNGQIDETSETGQLSPDDQFLVGPVPPNPPIEQAFPQLFNPSVTTFNTQSGIRADYLPTDTAAGTAELPALSAGELFARHLYCLMFRLILDPVVDTTDATQELVPNFPYPTGMTTAPADVGFRNRYVAKRLAQWAVNAVDLRDTNAIMTRLRYDPNPFDNNGFDLLTAATNVVWGMERREIELTETISFHDRRVKRNLNTIDPMLYSPTDLDADGEYQGDEADSDPMNAPVSDQDLDQFRIPEASSIVEIHSLRSPYDPAVPFTQESYPSELYDFSGSVPRLDLGRMAGTGNAQSPVWRLAVGYTDRDGSPGSAHRRSALWVNEAERFATIDPTLPNPMTGLTGAGADHTAGNVNSNWNQRIRHVAEVGQLVGQNGQVFLYDDDLDPSNGVPEAISLSRFVWFTNTAPSATFNVISNPASGMQPGNVFFRTGIRDTVNAPTPPSTGGFDNLDPMLEGGQYAVVLPRSSTVLGSTRDSMASNLWAYRPSPQRLELLGEVLPGPTNAYEHRYVDFGNERGSPRAQLAGVPYRIRNALPIVTASLMPWQIDGARTDWADYSDITGAPTNIAALNAVQRVNVGFNISAPLSGTDYYDAPTYFINSGGANPTDAYPFCDGYRDYEQDLGIHEDVPFDERATAPLQQNGWVGMGDYQDVATMFLQRLADPTQPWDATNNPYITVDLLTMDLTVFNGEEDLNQVIDRDGDMTAAEPVDPNTPVYPAQLAFDTRRKIPDSNRERPLSTLVPINLGGDLADISNYARLLYAQRSPLMSLQGVLRDKLPDTSIGLPTRPYFNFELISAWENDAPAAATANLNTNFLHQPDQHRFDAPADPYPQSLGFLNREFGEPAQAFTAFAGSIDGTQSGYYFGYPIGVTVLMPIHSNRPFQSPYELVTVPAVAASRMNMDFSPGTIYTSPPHLEAPGPFNHLLGFERNIGDFDPADVANLAAGPAATVDATTAAGFNQLTGSRAGFEQIFDLVDTGPLSFGQRRWIDPRQLTRATGGSVLDDMFNRVISTMQPPFNYVDRHRTEGKINLNTTSDYIRQGANYSGTFNPNDPDPNLALRFQQPLDAGERPEAPAIAGAINGIAAEPSNYRAGQPGDPINSSVLYGNGSIYRSLAWGHSTAYELDDVAGEPIVMGQVNRYKSSVDSRFGMGFKAFIESRRGYATSYAEVNGNWNSGTHFRNLDLDFRYPSRFAGMFAPAAGSTLPSVQQYLRMAAYNPAQAILRRTHDMSLLRPHPDFDVRLMDDTDTDDTPSEYADDRMTATSRSAYLIGVETPPPNSPPYQVAMPTLRYVPNTSGNNGGNVPAINSPGTLQFSVAGTGLLERPQAELHKNIRQLDRDTNFRFQNASRMSNLTTHHSNVFMVRFTIGYFEVDPNTGALDQEFLDPREGYQRPRGFYLVDRSLPVAYEPGKQHNSRNTVIFSSIEE